MLGSSMPYFTDTSRVGSAMMGKSICGSNSSRVSRLLLHQA